jgi:hypothetical protein
MKSKKLNRLAACLLSAGFWCFYSMMAMAQPQPDAQIKGRIIDNRTNNPLAGVSVKVLSTGTTTTTDAEGAFVVNAKRGDNIELSYVGYETETVTITNEDYLNLDLSPVFNQLNEVVVTALGIKKEKKRLGYALQGCEG